MHIPGRDPEAILARIREEEAKATQGKLKIFFGAAAGVGKTYAMLVEAHERQRAGVGVVVGVVETHGRPETAALLEGFEALPLRDVEYRGTRLREFDLNECGLCARRVAEHHRPRKGTCCASGPVVRIEC